jgi:23S rRNA (guanosine2251-2'-O)-methyltransferase
MTGKQRSGAGGGAGGGVAKGGQGGRGAKPGSHRKGAAVGSGGQGRKKLEGRGPTPPASSAPSTRPPARPRLRRGAPRRAGGARRANPASATRPSTGQPVPRGVRKGAGDAPETVVGRNPVVEALRAKVPATALYVVIGVDADERVTEAVALAGRPGSR